MQLDMHYYGTYAMARAAGLDPEAAKTIATCAQFVDDNVADVHVELREGSRVDAVATAHHTVDTANLEPADQRQVWVPFHFLPGNVGENYTERLKCRKDSKIAQELVAHHLRLAAQPYAASLIGITAHVYADTFSHYGFSGVSSRRNKVINDSFEFYELDQRMRTYITRKADLFRKKPGAQLFANIQSWLAETASGALGHGAVATFPDRPYLIWSFEYEGVDAVAGKVSKRNNQETFLDGCEALHKMFRRFAAMRTDLRSDDEREFDDIRGAVAEVLAVQGTKEERIAAWQKVADEGSVFGPGNISIPDYQGAAWNESWKALDGGQGSEVVFPHPVWSFYQAAAVHRTYVLRQLLPSHGLLVS